MPLQKLDKYEKHDSLSLRQWKNGETRTLTFLDDGRDVTTVNGLQVVYTVTEGHREEPVSLWIKPGGSLHIGVADYLPLKGRTLTMMKTIVKDDVVKGTRYVAVPAMEQEKLPAKKGK